MSIGAGKFLGPMNTFVERYDPVWINKLPDTPLAIYDGILPESIVGADIRGAVPVLEQSKIEYALYVGNGPNLITDSADEAGMLAFDNFNDTKDAKAVGGRIGFSPIPQIDFGYGAQYSSVGASGSGYSGVDAWLQSVDFDTWYDDTAILGKVVLRGQYAWSTVDDATYFQEGDEGFGPLNFSNDRDGGYIQLSYRPTRLSNRILRNFELIGRYDQIDVPADAPGGTDEQRWTFGLDYWVYSNFVVKAAYEFDSKDNEEDNNAFLTQAAVGF